MEASNPEDTKHGRQGFLYTAAAAAAALVVWCPVFALGFAIVFPVRAFILFFVVVGKEREIQNFLSLSLDGSIS